VRLPALMLPLSLGASWSAHAVDVDDTPPVVDPGATPGAFFLADAAGTVVPVVEDDGGLWLPGGVRAWRTGRVVVALESPGDRATLDAIARQDGVVWLEPVRADRGIHVLEVGPGVDSLPLSVGLAGLPGVRFAHPDLEVQLAPHVTDDPLLGDAWHLDNTGQRGGVPGADVGAFDAWSLATGRDQVIAIIDTGIDLAHPDLDLLPGFDVADDDDDPSPDPSYDGYGHGTAMAGVAAAIGGNAEGTAGVAPDARILPVKLIGNTGSFLDIYDAFVESVDAGAAVLSNSWGFSAQDCPAVPLPGVIADGFDYAETQGRDGRGTAIAMSYGNGGCDASDDGFHLDPRVITVGAATDLDRRVGYSNYGVGLEIMGFGGGDGRPGLVTTDITGEAGYGGQDYWYGGSGTSSACASVAGVLALLFDANPRLTAAQARRVLCDTAVKPAWEDTGWDADGWSLTYGCGRVDAAAAVAAVADAGPPELVPLDPGRVREDRVVLFWTASDPDDDTIRTDVVLRGPAGAEVMVEAVPGAEVELTGQVGPGAWTWTLRPADAWGPGPEVEGPPFTVEALPEPESGGACASVGGAGLPWLVLAPLLVLIRRRR
jgi:subtilisin family serine protease